MHDIVHSTNAIVQCPFREQGTAAHLLCMGVVHDICIVAAAIHMSLVAFCSGWGDWPVCFGMMHPCRLHSRVRSGPLKNHCPRCHCHLTIHRWPWLHLHLHPYSHPHAITITIILVIIIITTVTFKLMRAAARASHWLALAACGCGAMMSARVREQPKATIARLPAIRCAAAARERVRVRVRLTVGLVTMYSISTLTVCPAMWRPTRPRPLQAPVVACSAARWWQCRPHAPHLKGTQQGSCSCSCRCGCGCGCGPSMCVHSPSLTAMTQCQCQCRCQLWV